MNSSSLPFQPTRWRGTAGRPSTGGGLRAGAPAGRMLRTASPGPGLRRCKSRASSPKSASTGMTSARWGALTNHATESVHRRHPLPRPPKGGHSRCHGAYFRKAVAKAGSAGSGNACSGSPRGGAHHAARGAGSAAWRPTRAAACFRLLKSVASPLHGSATPSSGGP